MFQQVRGCLRILFLRDDVDGEPLAVLVKNAIPDELVESTLPALHRFKKYGTYTRGSYSGLPYAGPNLTDGSVSKTNVTFNAEGKQENVLSSVA